jgi:hypothetical protein
VSPSCFQVMPRQTMNVGGDASVRELLGRVGDFAAPFDLSSIGLALSSSRVNSAIQQFSYSLSRIGQLSAQGKRL